MYLELYYGPNGEIYTTPANEGFSEVPGLMEKLHEKGIEVETKDTGRMTEEERQEAYWKAARVAVRKKYKVRQVFGSRRQGGGPYFGKQVPALLVYGEKGALYPEDVYPHEEKGTTVTIAEFLEQLLSGLRSESLGL